jgi:hypothetical protein
MKFFGKSTAGIKIEIIFNLAFYNYPPGFDHNKNIFLELIIIFYKLRRGKWILH